MDIINELKIVFSEYFKKSFETFDENMSSAQIEHWDSTAHVGLVLQIERRFDVEFSPVELAQLTNVKNIKRVLERKLTSFST